MASALETRIRKLESRVAVAAVQSMGHVNKAPFDWEGFIRLFREIYAVHPEWWESDYVEKLDKAVIAVTAGRRTQ